MSLQVAQVLVRYKGVIWNLILTSPTDSTGMNLSSSWLDDMTDSMVRCITDSVGGNLCKLWEMVESLGSQRQTRRKE